MTAAWIGISPGHTLSTVAVRHGELCLWHQHVTRQPGPIGDYLQAVVAAVRAAVTETTATHAEDLADVVAVEMLHGPDDRLGLHGLYQLLDRAQVLGAVLAHWPDAVLVAPNPVIAPGRGAWHVAGTAPAVAHLHTTASGTTDRG